jgi:release factor glutamine methyltransferase
MATVKALLARAADLPGDSSRRDAEILLCHCIGKPRSWLYAWPEGQLDAALADRFDALLERRRRGEPVAHLIGEREFWSLDLKVNQYTLIPRPETETLVEWALELPVAGRAAVADLGTGSGAIALALASERPGWRMTAVDASAEALAVAAHNAAALGLQRVRLLQSDWCAALAGERFDLLVSNPPYVAPGDPHLEEGDLPFEPPAALVAGDEGYADIATIIRQAPARLARGGWLLLEHGHAQGAGVRALLRAAGFTAVQTRRDLGGRERISGGCIDAD